MLGTSWVFLLVTIPALVFGWDFQLPAGTSLNMYTLVGPICEDTPTHHFFCDNPDYPRLSVASVTYGRTDTTSCPYKGNVNAGENKNTNCAASLQAVTTAVYDRCNNQASCDVTPSNNFFGGDPCNGYYKYVSLRIMCKYKNL